MIINKIKTMTNEIQLINPIDYGLEETKANELIGGLPQIIKERSELEKQFDAIIKLDIENVETTIKARELRLLIQKNRTQGINIWHKTTKDFFLKGGQFVDAIKRKEVVVNERMESDLNEIEKYAEIKEQEKLEALQVERAEKLSLYLEDASERNLSGMDNDVWSAYFESKKKEYEDRIEAEKKAELKRIAKEKAEKEEQERIIKENEKLKKEAEEKERLAKIEREKIKKRNDDLKPYIIFIRDYNKVLNLPEKEFLLELENLSKAAILETKYKQEQQEKERIKAEKQAEFETKLKAKADAEINEKERIELILKAKEQVELKAKEAEEGRIQYELNKGDSEKVNDLIFDLKNLRIKYIFKSKKNQKMYNDVSLLLEKVINHISL